MTVQTIEFSGQELMHSHRKDLIEYFDTHPHLIASYQVFPDAVWHGTKKPALVAETMDLSAEQIGILIDGIAGLVSNELKFETPA